MVKGDRSDNGNGLNGGEGASSGGDSTLRNFDSSGAVKRGHWKDLLTAEVEATKNIDKDKTARHKKIKVVALIPC